MNWLPIVDYSYTFLNTFINVKHLNTDKFTTSPRLSIFKCPKVNIIWQICLAAWNIFRRGSLIPIRIVEKMHCRYAGFVPLLWSLSTLGINGFGIKRKKGIYFSFTSPPVNSFCPPERQEKRDYFGGWMAEAL